MRFSQRCRSLLVAEVISTTIGPQITFIQTSAKWGARCKTIWVYFCRSERCYHRHARPTLKATAAPDLYRIEQPLQSTGEQLFGGGHCRGRTRRFAVNEFERVGSYYALAKIGAVVVPLNWRWWQTNEFILKDSGTTRLIFDNEFVETVAELHSRGDKTNVRQWLHVTRGQAFRRYRAFRDAGDIGEPEVEPQITTCCTSCTPRGLVCPRGSCTHTMSIWGLLTIEGTAVYHDPERYLACLPMFHVVR